MFRRGIAELFEQDVLPLLNLMVLLLPIMLLGIELVSRSAIPISLPDPSPDVASLDTPPVPRPNVSGSEDHDEARSHTVPQPAPTTTAPSVFSDSPLGYGG